MYKFILLTFFSIILTCSLLVVLIPNPVHSILFLVLLFCNCTGVLLFYKIEFLATMLIIIYVGAIAVLFLFVIMMLDIKLVSNIKNDFYSYFLFCLLIIIIFNFQTFSLTFNIFENLEKITNTTESQYYWFNFLDNITNIETFGHSLYTDNMILVLISGYILLTALIGCVVLTKKKKLLKDNFKQISRKSQNAIFFIKNK